MRPAHLVRTGSASVAVALAATVAVVGAQGRIAANPCATAGLTTGAKPVTYPGTGTGCADSGPDGPATVFLYPKSKGPAIEAKLGKPTSSLSGLGKGAVFFNELQDGIVAFTGRSYFVEISGPEPNHARLEALARQIYRTLG